MPNRPLEGEQQVDQRWWAGPPEAGPQGKCWKGHRGCD